MSTTTDKLALFKYDPSTDGAQTFNIKQALNDNWDKLDDAVKQILITLANKANSIHADRHAKGGADPITPESIGAIPHLGQIKCFSDADAESAIDTFYSLMPNDSVAYGCVNMNVMGTTFTGGLHLIFLSKSDGNYGFVERNSYSDGNEGGDRVRKILLAGVWQPWEHFDPPFMIGPEYRTTERYFGRPVYCKAINAGTMPVANTVKLVAHGISNIAQCIKCFANWGGVVTFPYRFTGVVTVDRTNISLDSGSMVGLPSEDVMVCFYYTKTTD